MLATSDYIRFTPHAQGAGCRRFVAIPRTTRSRPPVGTRWPTSTGIEADGEFECASGSTAASAGSASGIRIASTDAITSDDFSTCGTRRRYAMRSWCVTGDRCVGAGGLWVLPADLAYRPPGGRVFSYAKLVLPARDESVPAAAGLRPVKELNRASQEEAPGEEAAEA
jgi:hypothetical protein